MQSCYKKEHKLARLPLRFNFPCFPWNTPQKALAYSGRPLEFLLGIFRSRFLYCKRAFLSINGYFLFQRTKYNVLYNFLEANGGVELFLKYAGKYFPLFFVKCLRNVKHIMKLFRLFVTIFCN